jgi:hypothetical protein
VGVALYRRDGGEVKCSEVNRRARREAAASAGNYSRGLGADHCPKLPDLRHGRVAELLVRVGCGAPSDEVGIFSLNFFPLSCNICDSICSLSRLLDITIVAEHIGIDRTRGSRFYVASVSRDLQYSFKRYISLQIAPRASRRPPCELYCSVAYVTSVRVNSRH